MSASDNAITLATHVIKATLTPFAAEQAGLIAARAIFQAGLAHEVEAALILLRRALIEPPPRREG